MKSCYFTIMVVLTILAGFFACAAPQKYPSEKEFAESGITCTWTVRYTVKRGYKGTSISPDIIIRSCSPQATDEEVSVHKEILFANPVLYFKCRSECYTVDIKTRTFRADGKLYKVPGVLAGTPSCTP